MRYITIPDPTPFLDPATKKVAKVQGEDGEITDAEPKDHAWFVHTFVLSHPIFSMKVGGYDAVRDQKLIGKELDKALDKGLPYYEVTTEQFRKMQITMRTPDKKDKDGAGDKDSRGMRPMTNFEAWCFFDHMDAIMNATTSPPVEDLPAPANSEESPDEQMMEAAE